MKSLNFSFILFLLTSIGLNAQAYTIGSVVENFKLKNVDGKMVSLSDYSDAKAYVIVFTCNHCPYAKFYEDRIIQMANDFRQQGVVLIAINPNDPELVPEDDYSQMVARAKMKSYSFPYLVDEKQEIFPKFGASRTPQVYLLDKQKILKYSGAIDDSAKDASLVKVKYLENALAAVLDGRNPDPQVTKAVGCSIKKKS